MASEKLFSRPTFLVCLFDDLTGKLKIGDSVSIIGHTSMVVSSSCNWNLPPSGYRFAEVKIIANNIFTPFDLNTIKFFPTPDLLLKKSIFSTKDGRNISLDKLCNAICYGRNADDIWPSLLPVSLLLSLVSSNANANSIKFDQSQNVPESSDHFSTVLSASTQTLGTSDFSSIRKQIHILISTDGFPSSISTCLFQAAGIYAVRSVYGSGSLVNDKLQSTLKQEDSSGDKQILFAGDLDLAKGGVIILDLSMLSKSKIKTLSDTLMGAGKSSFPNWQTPNPSEYGSATTTIWASLGRNCQRTNKSSFKLANFLVKGFDIVLQESSDLYISENSKLQQTQTLTGRVNNKNMPKGSPSHGFSADLQHHLMEASGISSMSISNSAYKLIHSYYLALRNNQEYFIDCNIEDNGEYASLLTLRSLLRVAEACARLCLKNEIREIPDAALAILLCEESHYGKFGRSMVISHYKDSPRKRKEETGFEDELYAFYIDLLRFLHISIPDHQAGR